jgi:8-oxo-dGTP diphosphatase
VTEFSGEPVGLEGQPLRWVPIAELATVGLLPGDQPIIAALDGR